MFIVTNNRCTNINNANLMYCMSKNRLYNFSHGFEPQNLVFFLRNAKATRQMFLSDYLDKLAPKISLKRIFGKLLRNTLHFKDHFKKSCQISQSAVAQIHWSKM